MIFLAAIATGAAIGLAYGFGAGAAIFVILAGIDGIYCSLAAIRDDVAAIRRRLK